jgi:hypothetical protein
MNKNELESIDQFVRKAEASKSHNAFFGWLNKDGRLAGTDSGACHAGFHRGAGDKTKLSYGLSCPRIGKRRDQTKRDQMRYIDWVVNTSPWRSAFVTHDPEEIYKTCYVLHLDIPCNFLMGALITSRSVNETYSTTVGERIRGWNKLVEMGIDPTRAHLYVSMFSNFGDVWKATSAQGGHWPLDVSCYDESYIYNYLHDNPINLGVDYTKSNSMFQAKAGEGSSVSVGKIWYSNTPIIQNNQDYCARLKPISMKRAVNLNIFYKEKLSNSYEFRGEKEISDLLSQLDSWVDGISESTEKKRVA